ncbi:DUF4391 domain-containing protein [Hespellia stercorisuis]|uniref:DUF4391 domain-containing protein n=1 Tax=Hespellia stercorisuis DSM 15480 TaxID=1121950 RepID=A0A1M6PP67_9FIRM|nr:DUF4391 domain-containing protein [Hespellia stercorisuis]SHK09697.1 protein of unknown function [Hespellia stercorisuis DSM 15480]
MFGLPKSTELVKPQQIPKTALFATYQMNAAEKARINRDISKIAITNEFSKAKINIEEGLEVKNFFVMNVAIKSKDFSDATIVKIAKLIPQKILMVLSFDDEVKFAVYHTKLLQTDWKKREKCRIEIKGMNLDAVWENIVAQIGAIKVQADSSLEEQLELKEKREKLCNEISKLEKQARNEKQPNKKFNLVKEINKIKEQLDNI